MTNNKNGFTILTGNFLEVVISEDCDVFYFKYDVEKDQKNVKEYICEMLSDVYNDSSLEFRIKKVSGILIRENKDVGINEIFFDECEKEYIENFIKFINREINDYYINPYESIISYINNNPNYLKTLGLKTNDKTDNKTGGSFSGF